MPPEQRRFIQVLEKCERWIEARWGFFAGLVLWGITIVILFLIGTMQLSERVQAASMITLVFITWYYAVQTQDLVKEEKQALIEETDKRAAEYGEKRITIFLHPFKERLLSLKLGLDIIIKPRNRRLIEQNEDMFYPIREVCYGSMKDFFFSKSFMCNDLLQKRVYEFFMEIERSWPTINNQEDSYLLSWRERMNLAINMLTALIDLEIETISTHIKRTYRYYVNAPLSWDELMPPKDQPHNE